MHLRRYECAFFSIVCLFTVVLLGGERFHLDYSIIPVNHETLEKEEKKHYEQHPNEEQPPPPSSSSSTLSVHAAS